MIDEMDRIIIVTAKPPNQEHQFVSGIPGESMNKGDSPVSGENGSVGSPVNAESDGESWRDLVQFHYAEDLHRPVTEVTATTTQKPNSEAGTEEEDDIELGDTEHASGFAKWLRFL